MHTCLTQSEAVLELYRKERKKQLLKSKRVFKFVNREPKKAGKKPTGHEAGIGGQVSNGRRPLIRTLPFPFDSHQIYSFFLFFISFLSLSLSSPRGSRSHSLLSPLPAVGALSIRQRRRTNSSSSSSAPIGFVLEQVGEASASIDRSIDPCLVRFRFFLICPCLVLLRFLMVFVWCDAGRGYSGWGFCGVRLVIGFCLVVWPCTLAPARCVLG